VQERELALRQAEERMALQSGGTVLAPVPQGEGPSAGPIDSSTQLVAYMPGSENAIVEAGGSGQVRNGRKEVDVTGGFSRVKPQFSRRSQSLGQPGSCPKQCLRECLGGWMLIMCAWIDSWASGSSTGTTRRRATTTITR
jgi:hypothetical protein